MVPTAVPRVGATVYARTTPVTAGLALSSGTIVGVVEVPPVSSVERLISAISTAAPVAAVEVPDNLMRVILITLVTQVIVTASPATTTSVKPTEYVGFQVSPKATIAGAEMLH